MKAIRPVTNDSQSSTFRKRWRPGARIGRLIVTTPGLGECISGAILYDETIRQQKKDGTPFLKVLTDAGIIPGIKVDTGAKDLAAHPGEKITEGLDGLRERLLGVFSNGRAFCQVARSDYHRR